MTTDKYKLVVAMGKSEMFEQLIESHSMQDYNLSTIHSVSD